MKLSSKDFDDLTAFLSAVETGSLTLAAARLGVSTSIVSRRVSRLEQRLRSKLLTRTPRGVEPTWIGQRYAAQIADVLSDLSSADEEVLRMSTEISGSIRLTLPPTSGVAIATPLLAEFVKKHPAIELEIVVSSENRSIDAEKFDLALRVGALSDSARIARRIGAFRDLVVASPHYIERHGRPDHPMDLRHHAALLNVPRDVVKPWRFKTENGWQDFAVDGNIRCNDLTSLLQFAIHGVGIAELPEFLVSPWIEANQLVPLLCAWEKPIYPLSIVLADNGKTRKCVSVLVAFLADAIKPRLTPQPWPVVPG